MPSQPSSSDASISTDDNIISTTSPRPLTEPVGTGKAVISSSQVVIIPRDGGPLSHLVNEEPEPIESKMQVNIQPTTNKNQHVEDETPGKEFEEPTQPELSTPTFEDQGSPIEDNKPLGWNPDEAFAKRLYNRTTQMILDDKRERKQEWFAINKEKELIAYERRNLQLERQQLEYEQRNLETRLQEVNKYSDLLPSAKELRDNMGVDFQSIIIWMEVIKDKAATEGITPKQAVSLIVQDLRSYSQLNSLQKSVIQAQQNLEALNMVIQEKKQAFASLVDLQSKGIQNDDLIELNSLVTNGFAGSVIRLDDKLVRGG